MLKRCSKACLRFQWKVGFGEELHHTTKKLQRRHLRIDVPFYLNKMCEDHGQKKSIERVAALTSHSEAAAQPNFEQNAPVRKCSTRARGVV